MHAADGEVETLKKAGWVVSNNEERQKIIAAKHGTEPEEVVDPAEDLDVLRSAYEAKHGAPPDKRWGPGRLMKEIG